MRIRFFWMGEEEREKAIERGTDCCCRRCAVYPLQLLYKRLYTTTATKNQDLELHSFVLGEEREIH